LQTLHALRDAIRFLNTTKLPIGRDGINRPSLFPFGTATGRNAHGKSFFNAHAGMRSFIKFPPDTIGVYIDWRTQEVGIAAERSDDRALKSAYGSGDVYHQLALLCGRTKDSDRVRWKNSDPDCREKMKRVQLGINYGMTVPTIARRLECHTLVANE